MCIRDSVEGLDPVDVRLDVSLVNVVQSINVSLVDVVQSMNDDRREAARRCVQLYPDFDEWSERDRNILFEVISDMFSKRLVHIREALHEGRCTGGDIVDNNFARVHTTLHLENDDFFLGQHEYEKRAIPWLCALVSMDCLLYTSPSPRDATLSRMPSSA